MRGDYPSPDNVRNMSSVFIAGVVVYVMLMVSFDSPIVAVAVSATVAVTCTGVTEIVVFRDGIMVGVVLTAITVTLCIVPNCGGEVYDIFSFILYLTFIPITTLLLPDGGVTVKLPVAFVST
jgi:hypothetical protein